MTDCLRLSTFCRYPTKLYSIEPRRWKKRVSPNLW